MSFFHLKNSKEILLANIIEFDKLLTSLSEDMTNITKDMNNIMKDFEKNNKETLKNEIILYNDTIMSIEKAKQKIININNNALKLNNEIDFTKNLWISFLNKSNIYDNDSYELHKNKTIIFYDEIKNKYNCYISQELFQNTIEQLNYYLIQLNKIII